MMESGNLGAANLFANKDTLLKVAAAYFGEKAANQVVDDITKLGDLAKAEPDLLRPRVLQEGLQRFFAKLSREHHIDGDQVAEDYKRLSEHVLKLYQNGEGEKAAKILGEDFVRLFKQGRQEYNSHGLGAQLETAAHALSQAGAHPGMLVAMICKAVVLYAMFCSQEHDRVEKLSKGLREIIKPESHMGLHTANQSERREEQIEEDRRRLANRGGHPAPSVQPPQPHYDQQQLGREGAGPGGDPEADGGHTPV